MQQLRVPWWKRVLFGLASTATVFFLALALLVAADIHRDQDFHWGNGGEEQVVGFFLIFGGAAVFVTYLLLVVPLIVLWTTRSQLKHWYALIFAALLYPLIMHWVTMPLPLGRFWQGIEQSPGLYSYEELFALFASTGYLLLIAREKRKIEASRSA